MPPPLHDAACVRAADSERDQHSGICSNVSEMCYKTHEVEMGKKNRQLVVIKESSYDPFQTPLDLISLHVTEVFTRKVA